MSATAELVKAELPEPVARRGVTEPAWRTLCNNLYPGADPQSVLMVVDYCRARNLDPLKKPCHIVPMQVKDARSGEWAWRDVVMPGIYEYRITAQRTGLYLGHTPPSFGPMTKYLGVEAPEWCEMTFSRWNTQAQQAVPFPVRVFFREVCGTSKDKKSGEIEINSRWTKAPIQMLTKCSEAAGLREAFPEEFGGEATAEEMDGQRSIDINAERSVPPQPAQRKSQQQTETNGSPATATSSEAPSANSSSPAPETSPLKTPSDAPSAAAASAPINVGVIPEDGIREKGNAILITLNTGYRCSTRNATLMQAAATHRDAQALVELVGRASSDPKRFAPILEEIIVVKDE